MNRRDRLLTMAMIGMSAAVWGCGGQGRQGGTGAGTGAGTGPGDLEQRVQKLEDDLNKYFDKNGTDDKSAWAYWVVLAKAICQIEKHMDSPTFPPVQDRVCPKPGGGPDKISPPPYPPQ